MNLINYYWYFQSAIPSRICDDIAKQKYIGFKLGETDTGDVWSAPSISVDDLVEAAMVKGPAV